MYLAASELRPCVLIADIGATTSRLAVLGANGRPARVLIVSNEAVAGVEAAIARYLEHVGLKPEGAVLAIAGPIDGDTIALTNRPWRFSLATLRARFGFSQVQAVNDFEAVAWALTRLGPDDVWPLRNATGADAAVEGGTKVVFGPGSGLGVAALVRGAQGWTAVASEGGHVSFGPAAPDEEAVFERLREVDGPVSAETVLCGPGLERLHCALHPQHPALTAATIVTGAAAGDERARATVSLFVKLLGRFAGDLALMFKATGGIFMAGGVAQRLQHLYDARVFRTAFEAHPPYEALLATIPTVLVTLEEPGLLGCAVIAERFARAPATA
jgi:glucokinase